MVEGTGWVAEELKRHEGVLPQTVLQEYHEAPEA